MKVDFKNGWLKWNELNICKKSKIIDKSTQRVY